MILTIGHSTRTADEFLALLEAHGVAGLADVRTVPRSRRHPQFSADTLAAFLSAHGIEYLHLPGLGGLRKPRPDSPNGGWLNSSFRGYADHMQTPEFRVALERLISFSTGRQVAVMCAEALWWQCHRRLLADALVARGVEVMHILASGATQRHELTPFARIREGRVSYLGLV